MWTTSTGVHGKQFTAWNGTTKFLRTSSLLKERHPALAEAKGKTRSRALEAAGNQAAGILEGWLGADTRESVACRNMSAGGEEVARVVFAVFLCVFRSCLTERSNAHGVACCRCPWSVPRPHDYAESSFSGAWWSGIPAQISNSLPKRPTAVSSAATMVREPSLPPKCTRSSSWSPPVGTGRMCSLSIAPVYLRSRVATGGPARFVFARCLCAAHGKVSPSGGHMWHAIRASLQR